jgi:hypothetical protein
MERDEICRDLKLSNDSEEDRTAYADASSWICRMR